MEDEADVANAEAGDVCNLLVGAVVLKFEFEDFPLVWGELFDEFPGAIGEFMEVTAVPGVWVVCGDLIQQDVMTELHALFLAEHVQGAVAADAVEPGFEVVLDFGGVCLIEFEEGVLDDLTGAVEVAIEDACRIGYEGAFILIQCLPDQMLCGGRVTRVWHGFILHG
jgi:hypothetical protein